jgi:hypothetical protein
MYNKQKIFEQAKEEFPTMGINESLQYFTKESQFTNEKEFVKSFLQIIYDVIFKIYGYEIENIELERTFNLRQYDLPNQRIDIYCTTKQGIDLFIECKNPTNNFGELNLSLGQMMNYQMIIESLENPTILIFTTSRFHFYMAKTMKRFGLEFDVILHNKVLTSFLLKSEL